MQTYKEQVEAALQAALWLAAQGVPCFPCREDKKPACQHGHKDATKDPAALRELWLWYPGTLVGVPTGATTGINALDIDPRHGGDKYLSSVAAYLPLSQTHYTRSGGMHILFKHIDGLRCSVNKIAPGVDVRADGGYIIWWPFTGLGVLHGGMFAEWPQWLVYKLLVPLRNGTPIVKQQTSNYAQSALRKSAAAVAAEPEGGRNQRLNDEVYSLARFIESGELTPKDIALELVRASRKAGLTRLEIVNTVASALRAKGV